MTNIIKSWQKLLLPPMRIPQTGKRIKPPHPYDLLISFTVLRVWEYLETSKYSTFQKGEESEAKLLMDFYNNFCETHGLTKNNVAVVEPGDPKYETFLALELSLFDPNRIESFLNYHKKIFGKDGFEDLIEFQVYDLLGFYLPIENTERKKIIMVWVNKSRERNKQPSKIANNKKQDEDDIKLIWHNDYVSILKKLSKRLWKAQFTKRQLDFENVFTEGKAIKWNKGPELLCYLLFELRSRKPPLFKASKGNGHYKVAVQYFSDNSGKLANKNYVSDTIYKFKIRNIGKSMPERDLIKQMIELSL